MRVFIATLVVAAAPLLAQPVPSDRLAELKDYFSRLEKLGFSGIMILGDQQNTLAQGAYGFANREKGARMTMDLVQNIGSITKQFTAAAILKLEEQGKLKTSDSIAMHLPNVPDAKKAITIHHLLTHTAGLRSDYGPGDFEPVLRDEYLKRVMAVPLESEPGERFRYANSGYSLLAAIVELKSGKSYEAYLRENLFLPASMTNTGYLLPKFKDEELPLGYREGQPMTPVVRKEFAADGPYWNLRGNGGIATTPEDMLRWDRALNSGKVLSKASVEKLQTGYVAEGMGGPTKYAYGWSVSNTPLGKLVEHNGGDGVFIADFLRWTDKGLAFFIASTDSAWPAARLSRAVPAILDGRPYPKPPAVVELSADQLKTRDGKYVLNSGAAFQLRAQSGQLLLSPENDSAFALLLGVAKNESQKALSERTKAICEASARGDYKLFHDAINGPMPFEKRAALEGGRQKERAARLGPFQRVEIVGTRQQGPMTIVVSRLVHERGADLFEFGWDGDLVLIRPATATATQRLYPVSLNEFVSYQLGSTSTNRIQFNADDVSVEVSGTKYSAQKVN